LPVLVGAGASPMNITPAPGLPSPKTSCVAVAFRPHPRNAKAFRGGRPGFSRGGGFERGCLDDAGWEGRAGSRMTRGSLRSSAAARREGFQLPCERTRGRETRRTGHAACHQRRYRRPFPHTSAEVRQVFSHGQNRLRASREIISCTILTTFQLAASTYVRNKGRLPFSQLLSNLARIEVLSAILYA